MNYIKRYESSNTQLFYDGQNLFKNMNMNT